MDSSCFSIRRMRAFSVFIASAIAIALQVCGSAMAQEDIWVPEVPLVRETGVSARALGMGGAYLSLSDDVTALHYNIAGLARVERIEIAGSLLNLNRRLTTTMHGDRVESDFPRTRFTGLGLAYPFPTYRGSLVFGIGYDAPWILDRTYRREAVWDDGAEALSEEVHDEGSAGEWSIGLAGDATPTVSIGARATWIHGSHFQDWIFDRENPSGSFHAHEVIDVDISGYTGSLGALARLGDWGRLGVVLDLPRWINLSGTLSVVDDPDDEIGYDVEEDLTLPFSVGAGLSAAYRGLLATGDVRFTDWTQIDYEGPLRFGEGTGREFAYRSTADLHLGLEYLLDVSRDAGVRLRAGYAYEPVPYRVVLEDIVEGEFEPVPVYREASFHPDRSTFSVGAGILLQESLTVDAGFSTSHFERRGGSVIEEERENQFALSAAFRLQ